jgi:ABC-type branched-subunit amino acid transport system ATPase component
MSLLEVEGATCTFGGVRALDACSLAVAPGSITGLIGPNGAGKTTLLNAVTGYTRISAGHVRFDGASIENRPPSAVLGTGLGRTFQAGRVFPGLTVLENMHLGIRRTPLRRFRKWTLASERERSLALLGLMGLDQMAFDRADTLSHGQRKLLELAFVLSGEPRLILLDEPAAGVNPSLLVQLAERIRTLNERGIAFLIVEHDMEFLLGLSHRLLVMHQGRVIAAGAPDKVRADQAVLDAYLGGVEAE